jgi:MFS family permease
MQKNGTEKRGLIALRNVGHGANDIYWFILPSLLPVILEQFDLKYGSAGGLLTAYLGTIALFSFLLGKASDFLPRQRVLGTGFIIASSSLIIAAFMGGVVPFTVFLLIAGIGVSSYHPAIYASIEETTSHSQGTVYGMFELWGSAAVFLMFLLHGFLLREIGWRTILTVTSIPGLLIGMLYLYYGKMFHSGKAPQREFVTPKTAPKSSIAPFVLLLLVVTFRFIGMIAVINFTPTYLVREIGLDKSIASWATAIYFLGGLVFTPIAGRLSDRWGPFPVLLGATGMVGPFIYLLSTSSPLWAIFLYLIPIGACYYGAGPPQNILIAMLGERIGKGEAFGYMMAVIAVTFSFSPLLFGISADRIGLGGSIRIFSIPVGLSFVLIIVLWIIHSKPARIAAGKTRA